MVSSTVIVISILVGFMVLALVCYYCYTKNMSHRSPHKDVDGIGVLGVDHLLHPGTGVARLELDVDLETDEPSRRQSALEDFGFVVSDDEEEVEEEIMVVFDEVSRLREDDDDDEEEDECDAEYEKSPRPKKSNLASAGLVDALPSAPASSTSAVLSPPPMSQSQQQQSGPPSPPGKGAGGAGLGILAAGFKTKKEAEKTKRKSKSKRGKKPTSKAESKSDEKLVVEASKTKPGVKKKPDKRLAAAKNPVDKAYFSAFTNAEVYPQDDFIVDIWVYVLAKRAEMLEMATANDEKEKGKKGPVSLERRKQYTLTLDVNKEVFAVHNESETFEWQGETTNVQFGLTCIGKQSGRKMAKATLSTAEGVQVAVLLFSITVSSDAKAQVVTAEPVDTASSLTVLPFSSRNIHIFISYRRTHVDLADRVKQTLQSFGYNVFLDIDPDSGLKAGNYQQQLESNLSDIPIFIPLMTPAPSGTDEVRSKLSSMATIKQFAKSNQIDYCYIELQLALSKEMDKLLIPVYRGVDIGTEMRDLPSDIAALASYNARQIHNDMFTESLKVIHNMIQDYY